MTTTVRKWHSHSRSGASSFLFRGIGVTLALSFHAVLISYCYFILEDGGWAGLILWYMPSMVLGLPWSILGSLFFAEAGVIAVFGSVVLNGYLIGWLLDKLCS